MFKTLLSWCIGILFPIRCIGCNGYDNWLCTRCLAQWPEAPGALSYYQVPLLKRAIQQMKYQQSPGISEVLGQALAQRIDPNTYDVVVPVPMHWWKRWQRGYNQTALLAAQFPKAIYPALRKTRTTHSQAGLNRQQRQLNLVGSFQVIPRWQPLLRGKRVLIIDDVYSTGATTTECTTQLLRAGVAEVQIAVVALNVLIRT